MKTKWRKMETFLWFHQPRRGLLGLKNRPGNHHRRSAEMRAA
jgi:hypothetical protein